MKNSIFFLRNKGLLFIFFLCYLQNLSFAQIKDPPIPKDNRDTASSDIINIEWADEFTYNIVEKDTFQRLTGKVELSQDTVYMYCDSALIFNSTNLTAEGHVIIQQGDSITIFSDSLVYESHDRIADFYGEVVLVNRAQKLFTNHLNYDMKTKVGTYFNGATLTNDTTFLTSTKGYYFVKQDEIFFKDSVVIVDPDFVLRSDTLKFNTETKIATFLGPTLITQDTARIYCEAGFYNIENKTAEFRKNPQYVKNEQRAWADVMRYDGTDKMVTMEGNARFEEDDQLATADLIRYDEVNDVTYLEGNAQSQDGEQNILADTITYDKKNETYATRGRSHIVDPPQILDADQVDYDKENGIGIATGNVIWRDTVENLTVVCEHADYDNERNYLKASGGRANRPLFITAIDGDSLFMTSDTLVSIQEIDTLTQDTTRILVAFREVRVYKEDLQATCDSLIYNTTDSLMRFFIDPIVWSDTSQFTADSILMQIANGKIDKIFLNDNSFIVNSPDEFFFNQIKGKNSIAFFEDGELNRVRVEGNAESLYYPLDDDKAYIGANKTVCSEMLIYFGNNEVEGIKFFAQPKANLIPMNEANHEELKMPGFRWITKRRPKSVDDLFKPSTRKKKKNFVAPISESPILLDKEAALQKEKKEIKKEE